MKPIIPFFGIMFLAVTAYTQTLTAIHEFVGNEGGDPIGGLVLYEGTLYGMTQLGGANGNGTVFALGLDGSNFRVLKSFSATVNSPNYTNSDGAIPQARPNVSAGRLYGTARAGGNFGNGTVFAMNLDGSDFTVLKHFPALGDNGTNIGGGHPYAALVLSGQTLYGTAVDGGDGGRGTIFKINTDGSGFSVLKSFAGTPGSPYVTNSDGYWPYAGLALSGESLYGTAYQGGAFGGGTVFRINTNGSDFAVLKHFVANSDFNITNYGGMLPFAELAISDGVLFGTTVQGGASGVGTVFRMNTDGNDFAVLKDLTEEEGSKTWSPVTLQDGKLFGTTALGGTGRQGVIFRINTNGTDYVVLKHFSSEYPRQPEHPLGTLVTAGTTVFGISGGGAFSGGTVFRLDLGCVLNIQSIPGQVILSWSDPAFKLQTAPTISGLYTNVPNATSPFTNTTVAAQRFFRLIGD